MLVVPSALSPLKRRFISQLLWNEKVDFIFIIYNTVQIITDLTERDIHRYV